MKASEKIAILNREGIHEHNEKNWMSLLDFCEKTFYNKKVSTSYDNYFFPKSERYPAK
jgi:hypothetical protein